MRDVVEITVPKESANDEFAVLVEWKCPSGQAVEEGATIAVVEASKAVYDVHAPANGFLFYNREVGDKVPFGEPLAYLSQDEGFSVPDVKRTEEVRQGTRAIFTRKALKLMESQGIDETAFAGWKRVKAEDVLKYIDRPVKPGPPPSIAPLVLERRPLAASKVFEIESLRKSSGEVIYSNAVRQFPFTKVKEAVARKSGNAPSVSVGALLLSATARALPDFEYLNAFYAEDGAQIYGRVNIGVAMNLGKGLKVPVVSDAGRLSLTEVHDAMNELALKYMRDELTVQDMMQGTFTVSDLSSLGISFFTPLVNYQQSAILGICSKDAGGDFFNVILAFDHRLAEGMYAARFLERVEELALS
ncbi:MAG TPA: 2-oxo acid dehydrogenase subunit E2 [Vicinamibacteria bacterium]|jgi:pyruvate/2-oxoglutarate dehydrogenase complex dihydrolipoamide acyltransferase (E2) component